MQCHKNYGAFLCSFKSEGERNLHSNSKRCDGWRQILLDFSLSFYPLDAACRAENSFEFFALKRSTIELITVKLESFVRGCVFFTAAKQRDDKEDGKKMFFNKFCLLFDEFICDISKRFQLIKRTIKYAAIYDLLQSLDLFATLLSCLPSQEVIRNFHLFFFRDENWESFWHQNIFRHETWDFFSCWNLIHWSQLKEYLWVEL